MKQPQISPTLTWGSSNRVVLTGAAPVPSQQLAQVTLPEPAVCSLYIQASMTTIDPADTISLYVIRLTQGVGRVAVPREITFQNQPAQGAPLEFTIPFIPLHALQVDLLVYPNFFDPNNEITVETYLVLSPLTRIPQAEQQKLAFGMALPGEADDLDDELRAELEAEAPTVADIIAAEHPGRVEGQGEEPEADDLDDGAEIAGVPPIVLNVINRLTRRLGRQPTRGELQQALRRVQARAAQRRRRYG